MLHVILPPRDEFDGLDYEDFLSLFIQKKGAPFYLMTDGYRYRIVGEIIEYLRNNRAKVTGMLNDVNCSLMNCMNYGFRKKFIKNSSRFEDYLKVLEPMPDSEIGRLPPLRLRPRVYSCCAAKPIRSYFLIDGHQRVFAMIGRLLRGEPYIKLKKTRE